MKSQARNHQDDFNGELTSTLHKNFIIKDEIT